MKRYTAICFATLLFGACGDSEGGDGPPGSGGTGSSAASCADECRDYYDCHYSLCLLQGGSSCSTQRIDGLETCDRLVESDCTASLLSTYDSCEASDGSEATGDGSSGESEGDTSSSGWAESSGSSGSSGTGEACLPSNSFCDFDSECCSGVCDDDFAFCH